MGILNTSALLSPELLASEIPVSESGALTVLNGRKEAADIMKHRDDRLLVVVGPCSIHCPETALKYATKLKELSTRLSGDLCIFMRAYLEKPRTTVGWKGFINDPDLDGSFQINKGLRSSRILYAQLAEMGIPLASEMLDTISPVFLADLISVGAIGARTTESQLHREMASSVPFPIGFKNTTDGSINPAIDSIKSAKSQHRFLSMSSSGLGSIVHSSGNENCFVILRGGTAGTNYDQEHVQATKEVLTKQGHTPSIMIDCSHGNSQKDYRKQSIVAQTVGDQLRDGQTGIVGVMLESNIEEGRQDISAELKPGVSITDGCVGWTTTELILEALAESVRERRKVMAKQAEIDVQKVLREFNWMGKTGTTVTETVRAT